MRKENECEIVQDLLLNYVDGVLNNTSRELVENHLSKCDKCKEKLEDIKKDIEGNEKMQEKEVDYLKKVNKKISKKNKFIIIIGTILFIVIILNMFVFINYSKIACKMEIYLLDSVTEEELANIEQTIKSQDNNAEIVYHSKQYALEKMKEKFKENENLLSGYEEENNPFPASYTIKAKLDSVKNIKYETMSMPGVKTIISHIDDNPYELFLEKFFIKD